mgnify:CR=1 FL=1
MTGQYAHTIDAKGRLFIPAALRKELGQTFHITVGQDHCLSVYSDESWAAFMDKLKALAKIYGVSLDWLCSDSDMADEKPVEVVELLEDNATARAKNKKKRKFRCVAIVVVVCVITLTCIWIATRSENNEMPSKQFVDMGDESVDMPDQAVNGFDFEWKD